MNNNLSYTRCGDYEIPNLTLPEAENKPLGKYGRMRKNICRSTDRCCGTAWSCRRSCILIWGRSTRHQTRDWSDWCRNCLHQYLHRTRKSSRWNGCNTWIYWKHRQRKSSLTNWSITDALAACGNIHAPLFYFKSSHWFDDSFAENANPKLIIVKSVNTFAVWQIHFTIPCFFEQWTQYAGQCAFSRNGERSHESRKCNILTFDQYIIGDISIGYRAVSKMILNFGSRYQKYQRRYSYAKSSWYENINSECQNRGICSSFER